MNSALAVIAVCVVAFLQCSNGQLVIDLATGSVSGSAGGVTFVSGVTAGTAVPCSRQALLKITFTPGVIKRAIANFTFASTGSKDFTFDLGDSDTNNGWAGDADTKDNDAEVHSVNSGLYFYGRDTGPGVSAGLLHQEPNFVGVTPDLSLEFKDQQLRARNGNGFVHVHDYYLFQLNGQPDRLGVDYDLYLGVNRVVSGNYRSGTGLCNVVIQTYSS